MFRNFIGIYPFPNDGIRSVKVRTVCQLLYPFFFLAGGAFAAELRRCARDGKITVRHAHHLISDSIRLMFERIIDSPDGKLWLRAEGCR
ncbi:MAG: hypothetical protein M3178_00900 [Pseudomonadota bacterium]|nr:hypothetical protein [Pseudomonadota bacterium]